MKRIALFLQLEDGSAGTWLAVLFLIGVLMACCFINLATPDLSTKVVDLRANPALSYGKDGMIEGIKGCDDCRTWLAKGKHQ